MVFDATNLYKPSPQFAVFVVRSKSFDLRTKTKCRKLMSEAFHLRNRKQFPYSYRVVETRVQVLKNEKLAIENEPQATVSTAFSGSPKLSPVFLQHDRNTEKMFANSFTKLTLREIEREITCLFRLSKCKLSFLMPSLR